MARLIVVDKGLRVKQEQADWKQKYKELTREMEDLVTYQSEPLQHLANQFCIALEGHSPELDLSLASLREHLQHRSKLSQKLVKQIEQSVHDLDKHRESNSRALMDVVQQWLRLLKEQLHSERERKQLEEISSELPESSDVLYSLPSQLNRLLSLQSQICSLQDSAAEPGDLEGQIKKTRSELLQLLSQLQVPMANRGLLRDLLRDIEGELTLDQLPGLLQRTVQLIKLVATGNNSDFEQYLQAIKQQLADVQQVMLANVQDAQQAASNQRDLDEQFQTGVGSISQAVQESNNIDSLKLEVTSQLDLLTSAFDQFKQTEAERLEASQGRHHALEEKLAQMERESAEVRAHIEEEKKKARLDPLTGLPNRTAYLDILQHELQSWQRYDKAFSVVVGDIDHFKLVNDNYGHLAGDKVLRLIARMLSEKTRTADCVARFGGEEFVIVMPSTSASEAELVMNKLRGKISRSPFNFNGKPVTITMSFGVAEVVSGDTTDSLFARADEQLYRAKEQGRNQVCVAP